MIVSQVNVFAGDESRGTQFGKFEARTREDSIRLICEDDWDGEGCEWRIGLPFGGAMLVGDGQEAETRQRYEALVALAQSFGLKQTLVWTTDRAAADAASRLAAIERHNAACAHSDQYRRRYGAPIAV